MTPSQRFHLQSVDLHGMQRLADLLIEHLHSPLAVGLVGTLGAGKTSLVQALARAAGIDSGDVTSPTFTLLQTHHGSVRIHHLDAYRVADEDEFLELGVDELFDDPQAWTLIEWADRVPRVMPANSLWITISVDDDPSTRTVELVADASMEKLLARVVTDHSSADGTD
jgi:tRNA threonylcarbamoyladenosine biosynthesis protein TsaE